ncbi:tetratricopeptide repeat protein, partial [Inmirania thermothiophila]
PIQVQAVVYIVQRMAEMAALGVIAGVWAYLRGRRTGRWRWYGLSVLALAFGGLSKENAWIGPVLVVLAEYGVVRRGAVLATWRDRLVWSLPVAGLVWVVGDLALGGPLAGWLLPGYAYRSFTLVERLLTEPRVIGLHLGQWLWPWPERFSIEHEVAVSRGVLEPPTTLVGLLGVVVWVGGGLWLLWCGGRRRRVGFGLLWFAAALVVESTVVPLELVFEHRMYLPTVGLGVVTGVGVSWAWRRLRPAAVALPGALVLAALAASTSARLPVWRDNLTLYAEAVRHAPGSARAWVNYGLGLAQAGRHDEAMAAYRRALALEDLPEARHNLAMQLERRGRLREALAELDRAVARVPRLAPARLERGRIRHRLGDLRGAVEDYDAALALRPGWWVPLDNRALARLALGDVAGALADLDRAIGLAPAVARLWADRGAVRLVAGDPAAALADLERAVALGADDAGVHYNRGRALARLGRAEEAAAAWRRACALGLARACRAAGSRAREGTPAPFPGFGNGIPGREQESAGMTD